MFELTRRRAGVILVVFAALALGLGAFGSGLFDKVQGGGYSDQGSESARAATVLRDTFGEAAPNLVLLVETGSSVDDPAASAAASALARDLAAEPGVARVSSYWTDGKPAALRSADGGKGLIVASVLGTESEVDARIGDLAERFGGAHDPVEVRVGGYAMLLRETVQQTEKDVLLGESIAFPVTLIALLFVFGGLVAAALPLVVAAVTVLLTVGALTAVASLTDVAATASNVATLLGLGLAIDYSLLLISRFRDELDGGAEPAAALTATMRSAGRTVAFSAVTVAIALAGLLFFPLVAVRSMGYAGLLVAALAAVVSLTVLPALLLLLGHRIDRGRLRPRRRATGAAADGFWHRLATVVMRRPLPIGLAVAALLLLLGAPFLHVNLGFPDERALPREMASRQIAETLAAEFGITEQNGLFAVLPDSADGVGGYATALSDLPDVRRVDTVTGSYAGGMQFAAPGALHAGFGADGAAYLTIVPATDDPAALDRLVDEVRAVPAPSPVLIGGIAATNSDALASVTAALPLALGFVIVFMLVALFLLTGSVVLPVLALVLSALSLTATFGALVWIFQDGHLSGLLDFTVTGDLPPTVPVMLFGVAFGLAMDYQVFLLSRIGEEYRRTGDSEAAVALGLERIGRIVTAAAVLISLVLLGFLASDITFMKAFGIGLPLAVLVDATLVRGFLLPAGMKVLGDRVWYAPGFLRRAHARFGFDEGSPEPVPVADTPARWLIDEKPSGSSAPVPVAGGVSTREPSAFRAGKRERAAGERNGSRAVPRGGSERVGSSARVGGAVSATSEGDVAAPVAEIGPATAAPARADAAPAADVDSAATTAAVEGETVTTDDGPTTAVETGESAAAVAAEVTDDLPTAVEAGESAAAVAAEAMDGVPPTALETGQAATDGVLPTAPESGDATAATDAGATDDLPPPVVGSGDAAAGVAAADAAPVEKAAVRKRAPRKAVAAESVVSEHLSVAPAENEPAEKAPAKRAPRKAAAAAEAPAKRATARKTPAKKVAPAAVGDEVVPAKKTAARKTSARKAVTPAPVEGGTPAPAAEATPAKKATPRRTARKSAAPQAEVPLETSATPTPASTGDEAAPVEKATPRKTTARKTAASQAAPAEKPAARKTPAKRTTARKAPASPVADATPADATPTGPEPADPTATDLGTADATPVDSAAVGLTPATPAPATPAPVDQAAVDPTPADAVDATVTEQAASTAAEPTPRPPKRTAARKRAAGTAAKRAPAKRATRKAAPPASSDPAQPEFSADATPAVEPSPGAAAPTPLPLFSDAPATPAAETTPTATSPAPETSTNTTPPAKKTPARKTPAKRTTARKTATPIANGATKTPAERTPRKTTAAEETP
ncbi:MMPL family transporter [Nocardia sp. NPDC050697]|uniref:MMPL family transporter n=1 Tax=Nocardia sp. NPDC050697 TaxID=3155158 RepID=UPI003400A897